MKAFHENMRRSPHSMERMLAGVDFYWRRPREIALVETFAHQQEKRASDHGGSARRKSRPAFVKHGGGTGFHLRERRTRSDRRCTRTRLA